MFAFVSITEREADCWPSRLPGQSSVLRQCWLTAYLNRMSWLSPNYYSPQTAPARGREIERDTLTHSHTHKHSHTHIRGHLGHTLQLQSVGQQRGDSHRKSAKGVNFLKMTASGVFQTENFPTACLCVCVCVGPLGGKLCQCDPVLLSYLNSCHCVQHKQTSKTKLKCRRKLKRQPHKRLINMVLPKWTTIKIIKYKEE